LFLVLTQILVVVIVGAFISRSGYYVIFTYGLECVLTPADPLYHWRYSVEYGT
jgi:hypothetical protein